MGMIKTLNMLLKIGLMGISIQLIVSCACFPKEIPLHPKQIVQRLNKCKQYKMEPTSNSFKLTFEKDLPLTDCLVDGYFVFTDDELYKAQSMIQDAKKCYEDNCR